MNYLRNFYRSFTKTAREFPLDGETKKALSTLAKSNFCSLKTDVADETKTTVRKMLKTRDGSIGNTRDTGGAKYLPFV